MLGDDLDAALVELRAHAASRRRSTCDVGRETGETTTVDRLKVPALALQHTAVSLRLKTAGTAAVTIGGTVYETATAAGHLPFDLVDLVDDDVIKITAGEWADTYWRVVKATMQDQATERRVPLEQTSRPAGWPS